MKTLIYFFIAIWSITHITDLQAQKIFEDDISMSLGVQNSLYVELENSNRKLAEKMWKEYIKDYGKTKNNKKAKEWYTLASKVPAISTATELDIYTKFEEMGNMTRVYFWFDVGSAFLNTIDHEKESIGAEMFIKDYALSVKKEVIKKELEEQEKVLKKMQKELSKLEKNNEKYHKDIEEARKKIQEREQDIEKNLTDQEQRKYEIQEQMKIVEEVIQKINNLRKS